MKGIIIKGILLLSSSAYAYGATLVQENMHQAVSLPEISLISKSTHGDARDLDDDNDFQPDSHDYDDDNDGIPDHLDPDDDNDGILDAFDLDDDNDGIKDYEDFDDDNDLIVDSHDLDDNNNSGNNGGHMEIIAHIYKDHDQDGIPDSIDIGQRDTTDSDQDGVPDFTDVDDNNDGILD